MTVHRFGYHSASHRMFLLNVFSRYGVIVGRENVKQSVFSVEIPMGMDLSGLLRDVQHENSESTKYDTHVRYLKIQGIVF